MSQIAIVGGGIIGLSVAVALLREGKSVTVIDPGDEERRASFGNAGQLAQGEVVPLARPGVVTKIPGWILDPLGPLSVSLRYVPRALPFFTRFLCAATAQRAHETSRAMAELCNRMEDDWVEQLTLTGKLDFLSQSHVLRVYESRDEWDGNSFEWQLKTKAGVVFDAIGGEEIRTLEPRISPQFDFAIRMPLRRFIRNPGRLLRELGQWLQEHGVKFVADTVENFTQEGGRITGVALASGGALAANQIVVAAGAWSGRLAALLGDRVPLESERGYHIMIPSTANMLHGPVIYPARGIALTPMEQGLRISGVVEFAGLQAAPDPRRRQILFDAASLVLPQLAGRKEAVGPLWMGHRPSLPDSRPIIDRARTYHNVFYAFGHGHMGLSWAPTTALAVASLAAGETPDLDLTPYRLSRIR